MPDTGFQGESGLSLLRAGEAMGRRKEQELTLVSAYYYVHFAHSSLKTQYYFESKEVAGSRARVQIQVSLRPISKTFP